MSISSLDLTEAFADFHFMAVSSSFKPTIFFSSSGN
jgi:hypothetical protein